MNVSTSADTLGVGGVYKSGITPSLTVEVTDGRVAAFALQGVTDPQLIGALSRYGLYRRKKD